jgi:hypothetical protein
MEAQYNSGGSTAYAITYRQLYLTPDSFPRRKTAEPPFTLTSSTLQHYFLNATVNCYYFKGPQNAASCQTLANLCVLQVWIGMVKLRHSLTCKLSLLLRYAGFCCLR